MRRRAIAALIMFAAPAAAEPSATSTPKDADSQQQRQERHVVASPNPTIDDARTTADGGPVSAELTPARPDVTAHTAPHRPARPAAKRGRARTPKG